MATALTPSSNTKHWWPRLSPPRDDDCLFTDDVPASFRGRPHTASGAARPSWMTSVTNSSFTAASKSSRFNLAAVIGFGSKSKRQQPVDIQDPPSHIRSLPPLHSPDSHLDFGLSASRHRPPRAVASIESGTSGASTDAPLTPADPPSMALTDLTDPFASTSPLIERRSSAHSDKSLSKRLMQRIDGKTAKSATRLPVGDGPKRRESRDRSSTLPSRGRSSKDASEAYQALRAVEPPWAPSAPPDSPSIPSPSPPATIRQSKTSKPALPWSDTQADRGEHKLATHQRTPSSTSISNGNLTQGTSRRRTHSSRPSTSSSIPPSPSSSNFTPQSSSHSSSGHGSQPTDVPTLARPLPAPTLPAVLSTPLTPSSRSKPRPPPTSGLPPTPTPPQSSGSPSPPVRSPTPPFTEQHPLRSRSGTIASTSAVSFASSLSSLSFNSRPSPQEPPSVGAYDYPSLLNESLPIPGSDDPIIRRGSNSGSSSRSYMDGRDGSGPTSTVHKQKSSKSILPVSRHLPSPPATSASQVTSPKRERVASTASSTPEAVKTVRRQRSFHNTLLHAPTPMQPTLRHYNSFDPPTPPGLGGQVRSPPLPPLRSPPLAPTQDLPPLPPSASTGSKRGSIGKDSVTSPRRRLFGGKHDRDRERRQELDNVDTTVAQSAGSPGQASASSPGQVQGSSSSSWFDDRSAGSEPASASSTSTSTAQDVAQHIVPPAELLRLGAEWERELENESRSGLRRAKSNWGGSRELEGVRSLLGSSSSSKLASSRSAGKGSTAATMSTPTPSAGSKLPRSVSMLSKTSSAPSFSRSAHGTHAAPPSYASPSSAVPLDSYTSLSPPPPRRYQRSLVRGGPSQGGSTALPPPPRRTTTSASASASSGSSPPQPRGALIERKPSFLDMTSTRPSVTIDVPHYDSPGRELERDSFLELSSREMNSIDTIRESISSVDSFME